MKTIKQTATKSVAARKYLGLSQKAFGALVGHCGQSICKREKTVGELKFAANWLYELLAICSQAGLPATQVVDAMERVETSARSDIRQIHSVLHLLCTERPQTLSLSFFATEPTSDDLVNQSCLESLLRSFDGLIVDVENAALEEEESSISEDLREASEKIALARHSMLRARLKKAAVLAKSE